MSRVGDILDELITAVRGLTPQSETDDCFDCPEDGYGSVKAPQDWMLDPRRTMRQFDIRTVSTNPGPGCNFLSDALIRIAYPLTFDLGYLDRLIAEDIQTINVDLVSNPANWVDANSVFVPEGSDVVAEIVDDANGNSKNVVISIPITLDYRRAGVTTVYHPEIISLEDLGGQVARLTVAAKDQGYRLAKIPVTITLQHYLDDWTPITPAFIPRTYDLTSAGWAVDATQVDSINSITTTDEGVAVVDLYYAGEEIGIKRVRATAYGVSVTDTVSPRGDRVWVDKNNPAAADDPANGTQAAPYLTLLYGLGQVRDQDTAVIIPTAATYVETSAPMLTEQAAIVGLVAGIVVDPGSALKIRWAGTYGTPRMIRRIELDGGYIDTSGTPGDMLWSGCTVVSASAQGLYVRGTTWGTYVSGCDLSANAGSYYPITPYSTFIFGSIMRAAGVFGMYQNNDSRQWRSRNNTFELLDGWAIGLVDIANVTDADSRVESDYNTYTVDGGEAGFAYANGGAITYATLAEWQAATGLDANSTN